MKKKIVILNLFLTITMLSPLCYQAIHLFEDHPVLDKKCHHTYNFKAEITHEHQTLEECLICNFAFSSFLFPSTNSFYSKKVTAFTKQKNFTYNSITLSFYGSLYSYRGPPLA